MLIETNTENARSHVPGIEVCIDDITTGISVPTNSWARGQGSKLLMLKGLVISGK